MHRNQNLCQDQEQHIQFTSDQSRQKVLHQFMPQVRVFVHIVIYFYSTTCTPNYQQQCLRKQWPTSICCDEKQPEFRGKFCFADALSAMQLLLISIPAKRTIYRGQNSTWHVAKSVAQYLNFHCNFSTKPYTAPYLIS